MSSRPEKADVRREERGEASITRLDSHVPPSAQRRTHPRYSVDLDVSLGSDHNFYSGFAENLSAGGIFVATHLLKPVGSQIEVTIHVPDSEVPIRGRGEVRWIREYNERSDTPPGMGIRFYALEANAIEGIQAFLAQREPLFFDED